MDEIRIQDVSNIHIGQVEDRDAGTGCTVFICPEGMRAGLDVRGGGPASRENPILNPLMAARPIHGIVLAGGSTFGLCAGNGVVNYLEEQGIGFDVGVTHVPLVVQSDLFDLGVGDPKVRPDIKMGYEAAKTAMTAPNYRDGNFGAGTGCTVGKACGITSAMKTGIGSYAIQDGDLKIGAVVALNALGNIYDIETGEIIAGMLNSGRTGTDSIPYDYRKGFGAFEENVTSNTTLSVIITNARFSKSELCKIAGMGHDGYARSIRPVHTSADGDSIYAVSAGDVKADQDVVGSLAAEVISRAITRAVKSASGAYGFPSYSDLTMLQKQ